jgi:hypothetical protein
MVSAQAIVDQFQRARKDLSDDIRLACHLWAPILQSLGPGLLQEAQNALEYGETMVASWLENRMFAGQNDASEKTTRVALHFNKASLHKSHGRRISREEARSQGVIVEDLEDDQETQNGILTAYHVMTIIFEKTVASRMLLSNTAGRNWIKNTTQTPFQVPIQLPIQLPIPGPPNP